MPAINLKDFSAGTLRTSSLMFRKKVLKSFGRISGTRQPRVSESLMLRGLYSAGRADKSRNGMIHRPCRSPKLHSLFYGTPPKALFRLFLMCRQHKKASENRIKHKKPLTPKTQENQPQRHFYLSSTCGSWMRPMTNIAVTNNRSVKTKGRRRSILESHPAR